MNLKRALKAMILIMVVLVLCVSGLFVLIAWDDNRELRGTGTQKITYGEYTKYVDIYDVVGKAFVSNEGYTGELNGYMTKDVFF